MLYCNRNSLAVQCAATDYNVLRIVVFLYKGGRIPGRLTHLLSRRLGGKQLSFFASLMAINAHLHDNVTEGMHLFHSSTESSPIAIWSLVGMIHFQLPWAVSCSFMRQKERVHS